MAIDNTIKNITNMHSFKNGSSKISLEKTFFQTKLRSAKPEYTKGTYNSEKTILTVAIDKIHLESDSFH